MIRKSPTQALRERRHARIRAKVSGTAICPRVTVFRSNRAVSLQAINDLLGATLASGSILEMKNVKNTVDGAFELGKVFGEKCLKLGIKEAVFDRSGYRYHGKVKAVAEGIREAGIAM